MAMVVKTAEGFRHEVLDCQANALALFYAGWCPFCRAYLPVFRSHAGRRAAEPHYVEVDVSDEDNPLWEEYNIEIVPTLIRFQGGKEVGRVDGRPGQGLKESDIAKLVAPVP